MSHALLRITEAAKLDYSLPRRISVAANFFHAYPRLGGTSTVFATTTAYRVGIYRLGIPYFVTGAVLLLSALIANFYCFTRRGVVPGADDTRESNPNKRDAIGRAFLLFSCFLNLAIILCIAIAFGSGFTMRAAANSAHDVLRAASTNVSLHVEVPSRALKAFAEEARQKELTDVSEDEREAVENIKSIFERYSGHLDRVVANATYWFDRLDTIDNQVKYLSSRFFWFTVVVLVACIGGLVLAFFCDATTPDQKRTRIVCFVLLLLPLVAAWTHTAASTWIAVASGDFCQSVKEYHNVVALQSREKQAQMEESNVFRQYQLQCPKQTLVFTDIKGVNTLLGTANGYADFSKGMDVISGKDVGEERWEAAVEWMQDRLFIDYPKCETQLLLAGKISYYICGDHGSSAISAVGQLWLCSCGITLLYTVVVALLTWGHPPSEFCSGRELMYLFGAPRLISAFGDVKSILARQTAYQKLEAGLLESGEDCTSSSEGESFGKNSSKPTDSSISNEYVRHEVTGETPTQSDLHPYRDDDSTDSNGFT